MGIYLRYLADMDLSKIHDNLIGVCDITSNEINRLRYWSNAGAVGPRGCSAEVKFITKADCINLIEQTEKNLQILRKYIELDDAGLKEEHKRVMKHLKRIGGGM